MKIIKRLFSYLNARVSYSQRIAKLLNLKKEEVDKVYTEINNSEFIKEIVEKAGVKRGLFDFNMCMVLRAPTLYVLCRLLKPGAVVETGVADGFSSAFILYALEANQKGKLYSIDLPNQEGQEIKGGRQAGWLVPDNLKVRWELTLGDSRKELPALCDKLKNIDIFYHDSDHSYESMAFEFNTVITYVNKNGLIVSDDITDNSAFDDFCISVNCPNLKLFKLGIMRVGKNGTI